MELVGATVRPLYVRKDWTEGRVSAQEGRQVTVVVTGGDRQGETITLDPCNDAADRYDVLSEPSEDFGW